MPASAMDDIRNAYVNGLSIAPAVYTSTQVGTAVNMQPGTGPMCAVIQLGAISDTSTCSVTFTESATSGGSYTAIVGAPTISIAGTADATVVVSQLFERSLPYVKATATLGGSAISVAIGVSLHENSSSF